ncbi:spore germination protein [Pseudalkalibacillus caeni]|uniref:Spore germination protein n=1 Tax=Exobacillus caeni TaxID=2574798 RepID=A0A5R9EWE1_9BACL|nr:spore germination protein [Pseudalkalibacillus caeni]TLS34959.1 spore germination protein [Pseudalkalibacillus caeni]
MPVFNNIFNSKINNVTNNGSIIYGNGFNNSHTANTKAVGSNTTLGDFSPANGLTNNNYIDPDISDQGQLANPANGVVPQF